MFWSRFCFDDASTCTCLRLFFSFLSSLPSRSPVSLLPFGARLLAFALRRNDDPAQFLSCVIIVIATCATAAAVNNDDDDDDLHDAIEADDCC